MTKLTTGIKQYWFLIGLLIVMGLAWVYPEIGRKGGWIRSEITINYITVSLIFFISGLDLKTSTLLDALLYWRLILTVQSISFILLPVLTLGICKLLGLVGYNSNLIDGILISIICPTTVSSNVVMTQASHGNTAASLVNSVVGNSIGIIISPSLIILFFNLQAGNTKPIDFISVIVNLTLTILVPLVIGQLVRYWVPNVVNWISRVNLSNVNSVLLLLLIYTIFCESFYHHHFKGISVISFLILMIITIVQFGGFVVICWGIARQIGFDCRDVVAIVFSGASKSIVTGLPILYATFGSSDNVGLLAVPMIVYQALQLVMGAVLVNIFRDWVDGEIQRLNLDSNVHLEMTPLN
ncbi:putative sodium bile acid cotransporter [Globomyces pollinis-pini]|nr:putative sodium bile acid cotransporter [Globomyces pollinis-pini]